MKRAFLILGAESSGTRYLTSLFVAAGFVGSANHAQPTDLDEPTADCIVVRRSIPHGEKYPDLQILINRFQSLGYTVIALVIHRDPTATLNSQVKNFVAIDTIDDAWQRYQKAYKHIYTALATTNICYLGITYESLILNQQGVLDGLNNLLDLTLTVLPVINSNEKWYK